MKHQFANQEKHNGCSTENTDIAMKITDAFVDVLHCPPDWVNVVFRETDPEDYYTAGISTARERAERAAKEKLEK